MGAYPSILDAQTLRRLQAPQLPQDPVMASVAPVLPPPTPPSVTQGLPPPLTSPQITSSRLLGDQAELKRLGDQGSGISQIQNPLLHGLAKTGNVIESILAPRAAAFTPGTEENHQRLLGIQQGRVNSDLANQQAQAQTGQTEANTAYLAARPDIEQSKIDQRQTAVQERVGQAAAAHGQKVTWDENGIPSFEDDHESQAFLDHQALSAMHQSTADKNKLQDEIKKNNYIPGTPEYAQWREKMDQVDKRLQVAMGSLGLRAQGLDLRRQTTNAMLYGTDNAGNPLPGAAAITGDEGQQTTLGSRFAPTAIKANAKTATFNDLAGSVSHTRNALNQFFAEGGSLSDPTIVAAMRDPNSVIGKVINGKLVQGGLSPTAISAINAVRQLHEQAGILRSTTGGTSSEAGAQRILDVVPSAGDANAVALSKLNEQEQVLGRLAPGQTHVHGGVSVRPSGQATKGKPDPLGIR